MSIPNIFNKFANSTENNYFLFFTFITTIT